jgi:23S rRNA (adenine2503-C2)-methyltransferase
MPMNHLRNLSLAQLRELVLAAGEPEYRYRQLATWMYGRLEDDLAAMSDLPAPLRERLGATATGSSRC